MTDEGMCYKDALEWMTLNAKPTYDESGIEYRISGYKLMIADSIQGLPFTTAAFVGLRLFKSKPKPPPVYIPFWDAVKAAGQDGKCISKFECEGKGCSATYRYRREYPTEWQYWNGAENQWRNAWGFLNHSIDPLGTTLWAIVDGPSKES